MILIGQYDSPYVRRVGIALTLYDLPFEQWPWSTFGDADKIRPYNPLSRVPTLVLDEAEVIIESHMMLDYLDSLVPAANRLYPVNEPERRRALKVAALAMGTADKAVSLFYEKRMHTQVSDSWVARCKTQIFEALAVLEDDRSDRPASYWFGDRIGHADIAVAVMLRFVTEAHPGLLVHADYPALMAHAEMMERLPVFQTIRQEFIPPA